MAKTITYNATEDRIEADGGTEADPITWEDIYQEDQAQGWGFTTRESTGQGTSAESIETIYKCTKEVFFGEGTTTYFRSTKELIIAPAPHMQNTDAQLGELDADGNPQKGSIWVGYQTPNRWGLHLGGTRFYASAWVFDNRSKIYGWGDSKGSWASWAKLYQYSGDSVHRDSVVIGGVIRGTSGILTPWVERTYRKGGIGHSYNSTRYLREPNALRYGAAPNSTPEYPHVHVINPVVHPTNDMIKVVCNEPTDQEAHVHIDYEISAPLLDPDGNPLSGRTVTVYDKDGNQAAQWTTDTDGTADPASYSLPDVAYSAPFVEAEHHYQIGSGDTVHHVDHNPFRIEVSGDADYRTLSKTLDIYSEVKTPLTLFPWPVEPAEGDVKSGVNYFEDTRTGRFVGASHYLSADVSPPSVSTEVIAPTIDAEVS